MPLSSAALEPLLLLTLVSGVGPQRLSGLIRHFGSADRVLSVPIRDLEIFPGVGPELARRIREASRPEAGRRLREAQRALQRVGAAVVTPDEVAYPDAFRFIPDAPYLLYAAGDLSMLRGAGVAVVGTRSPTGYGRAAAATLTSGLASAGFTIVSGMARGIDTVAHRTALEAGAPTVGVLGHGIEQVYPAESRRLFAQMREQGLLITEFPPGERPRAGNFPRRNRLISALSQGVLVVEMGLKSGAQHTVGFALEQGREVFAVPGPIGAPSSAGTNQLIKDGARVVTCVEDVLEELRGVGSGRQLLRESSMAGGQMALPLLSADQQHVLQALSSEPRHVDELGRASGLSPGALLGTLLELELRGIAEALPGKHFRRV